MSTPRPTHNAKQLLQVATVTTVVAGCPVAAVWYLRASGAITSALVAVAMGMAISLLLSYLGRVVWETRKDSEDLLFSELMVWGYVHRLRSQRRLADAAAMLGAAGTHPAGSAEQAGASGQVKLLEQLVSGIETRDPYLHGHSRRVARHSWMIAHRMGLPSEEVARIRTAAAIHDVGKINTPKAILHKPGRLTDEEYEVIKRHPVEGAVMAGVLNDEVITSIIRHHHERADGSGYPDGLAGAEIPLGARIVAVADTFDAITSSRSYRAASAHKQAIDILKEEAGTRLDPDVVHAFCDHYAGRGPLALWSFVAGLPERFITWLGSSAAGVAAAAKVVAVAALVGGTTAATTTLAAKAPPDPHRSSAVALASSIAPAGLGSVRGGSAPSRPAPAASSLGKAHGRVHVGPRHGASRPRGTGSVGATVTSGPGETSAGRPGTSTEAPRSTGSEAPKAKGGEPKPKPEEPASKSKEAPRTVKHEEAPAKGKSEEAPAKGKTEEAPAKGKTEEAPAKGKTEEAPVKGKSEEASAKAKPEEASAKKK